MPSLWSFPTWLAAYVRWQELYASGVRLGPITPNNNGIFTFTAEEPR